ncbi:M28 family metallopeptidase [Pigmentiphaga soli]|uniref:M28 family metallopeptidase n=1 Tax=Pigmentiphaga soli TaxID=1007095 RepID=A0ABP8GGX0_9BURK
MLRPLATAAVLGLAACGGDDDPGGDDGNGTPAASCAERANDTEARLLACVTGDGALAHLQELDRIARANGGNRTSGSPGHDASAAYAEKVLADAGYAVTRQAFTFVQYTDLGGSALRQVSPAPAEDIPHRVMDYSGSGDVAAAPVFVAAGPGCGAADFAGLPAGAAALVERGDCSFYDKAMNAIAAGAAAVVVYNNESGDVEGSLSEAFSADVPVLETTREAGQRLAATPGLVLGIKAGTLRTSGTSYNVIAEGRGGGPDHVVVVGAHLDSVAAGPGINDNGSGSAAVLETAVQMAKVTPANRLRFALWGAEENGLLGSADYVDSLTEEERGRIALYLNFDMLASPNGGYFIYDGDDSDGVGEGPGPDGSATIEGAFEAFYQARGIPTKGTDFDGRSDYGPFIEYGIPAGGVFSGAEDLRTEEDAALWGGAAGIAFDPCYHQACDDLGNLDLAALEVNVDAVAAITLRFANSLEGLRPPAMPGAMARMQGGATRAQAYTPPADMRPRQAPARR